MLLLFAIPARSLGPIPHQTSEESLRGALDAVVRKQRSLEPSSQDYYNELRAFKYHGGEPERELERERQGEPEIDIDDEEIEFLPNENGQLETVGNGCQGMNNKLLERAIIDYNEDIPEQVEQVQSPFRERQRSSSRKRGGGSEHLAPDNKVPHMNDEEYLNTLLTVYDKYRPMSWSELLNKETLARAQTRDANDNDFLDRDQDQNIMYMTPADRRTANGHYPVSREFRNYRDLVKRYPVAKRSPRPVAIKKQITDPKVAQDLGALFGTQSSEIQNHTHEHDHEHDANANHNHDHTHDHKHDHDHSHDHDHNHDHSGLHSHQNTSEAPKVTPQPKGQEENMTKVGRSKSIEVRKKSVDWSQYFGIDRRRKKATFMPGQGTQNQDDAWMLQRYYENMAENLRSPSAQDYNRENERKEDLDMTEPQLKNINDLILEKLLRRAQLEDSAELQKVKDKLMARIVAAYSLEKLLKALNDLKNNVAGRMETQKSAHEQNNLTSPNFRGISNSGKAERRSNNFIEEVGLDEMQSCPELEAIDKRCKAASNLVGDGTQLLLVDCVLLQICKACEEDDTEDECLMSYKREVTKTCDAQAASEGRKAEEVCRSAGLALAQLEPPAEIAMRCLTNGNNCLRPFHYRFRRYLRNR